MGEVIKFRLSDWEGSYFEGYKNNRGRYIPVKKFVMDKYRAGYIEVKNTHKLCEFFKSEVVELVPS
jgi:hypothetical protein